MFFVYQRRFEKRIDSILLLVLIFTNLYKIESIDVHSYSLSTSCLTLAMSPSRYKAKVSRHDKQPHKSGKGSNRVILQLPRYDCSPHQNISKTFDSHQYGLTMSIPGLGQDEPEEELVRAGVPTEQVVTHELRKETEWRFEVAIGRSIEVKVCFCLG